MITDQQYNNKCSKTNVKQNAGNILDEEEAGKKDHILAQWHWHPA